MYSIDTIRRVVRMMTEFNEELMTKNVEDIKICISSGNKKIGRVMNVSLPPVLSCGNCKECMHYCYDIKACVQYANTVISARVRNWNVLLRDRDRFFSLVEDKISRRRRNKFFRWHVSGDIVDIDYFDRMVAIARRHPDFVFWTYTKMYHIVNEWCALNGGKEAIPSNFSIMFSEWRGLEMINPHNFAQFKCIMKGEEDPKGEVWFCPGNCDICKSAKRGCIVNETSYVHEH